MAVNKDAKFKLGEPVIIAYTYGETLSDKSRYGRPMFAVVNSIEYIQSRDAFLYTLVCESEFQPYKARYLTRGEAWLFKLNELDECQEFIKKNVISL